MLTICEKPTRKGNLFFKMETSHEVLNRWLNEALRRKLIENTDHMFQTTPKGLAFVKAWKKLQKFLQEE